MRKHNRYTKFSRGEAVIMAVAAILALIPAAGTAVALKFGAEPPEASLPMKEIETLSRLESLPEISSDEFCSTLEEPVAETETETLTEETDTESESESETSSPVIYDSEYAQGIFDAVQKLNSSFPSTVLKTTADGGDEYLDRIVFVGDSTTYGLKRYGMLSDGYKTQRVWTPASGTLSLPYASIGTIVYPKNGSEITIAQAAALDQPDIMIITLGVNGVSFMNGEKIKSAYSLLIDDILAVSPNTHIILQSIFPVAAHYEKIKSINNEKITAANYCIAELASEYNIGFLNTFEYLIGSDGFLPVEYQNGDGLHLNDKGYALELEYIRSHMLADSAPAVNQTDTAETPAETEETVTETADTESAETTPETETDSETETDAVEYEVETEMETDITDYETETENESAESESITETASEDTEYEEI